VLLYISGEDGSMVWEPNGMKNQFVFDRFEDDTFPFTFQHHAGSILRILPDVEWDKWTEG
jgi:hypothetical protein